MVAATATAAGSNDSSSNSSSGTDGRAPILENVKGSQDTSIEEQIVNPLLLA